MNHAFATLEGAVSNNGQVVHEMIMACNKAKLTIVNIAKHEFYPQGVSCSIILAESHMNIHTYPEKLLAYIDCFTCNPRQDPRVAIELFACKMMLEIKKMDFIRRKP